MAGGLRPRSWLAGWLGCCSGWLVPIFVLAGSAHALAGWLLFPFRLSGVPVSTVPLSYPPKRDLGVTDMDRTCDKPPRDVRSALRAMSLIPRYASDSEMNLTDWLPGTHRRICVKHHAGPTTLQEDGRTSVEALRPPASQTSKNAGRPSK